MKVLKFGGTSLGNPERMQQVAEIVEAQLGDAQQNILVVLSAVAGTTDALVLLANLLKSGDKQQAGLVLNELADQYRAYVDGLFDLAEQRSRAYSRVTAHLADIKELFNLVYVENFSFQILAKGELISTALFQYYLQTSQRNSQLLCALDYLRLNLDASPDLAYLRSRLKPRLNGPSQTIFVIQGFICRNALGDVANLKRGGSDYSASLFGAALSAEEVQIWTDIDGMHNNDPRYVQGTEPVRELSFNEAAELAYFGAKILHPSSIKPARKAGTPVRLLNTLDPKAEGTLISNQSTHAIIKAVAAKSGITAIKIRSSDMLQAPGFLRKVFEIFELYKTSIDMITTSEVAVSLTIDDETYLEPIIKSLIQLGQVEIDADLAIICVVGEFVVESKGLALRVLKALENIPLRMISYGGSPHNISLLVSQHRKEEALKALHQGLFHV